MQSILLICPDKTKRDAYIHLFCQKNNITIFDRTIIASETSLGVEAVRTMQKTAFLKPLHSENKLIIIENAHTATVEAQNALLKIVEEPPNQTIIMLTADNDHSLLPTILSRCSIIALDAEKKENTPEEKAEIEEQLATIMQGSVGDKLVLAQQLAEKKENINSWIRNMMLLMREHMLEDGQTIYAKHIAQLQEAHRLMETTNIQPRFIFEHFFLS